MTSQATKTDTGKLLAALNAVAPATAAALAEKLEESSTKPWEAADRKQSIQKQVRFNAVAMAKMEEVFNKHDPRPLSRTAMINEALEEYLDKKLKGMVQPLTNHSDAVLLTVPSIRSVDNPSTVFSKLSEQKHFDFTLSTHIATTPYVMMRAQVKRTDAKGVMVQVPTVLLDRMNKVCIGATSSTLTALAEWALDQLLSKNQTLNIENKE